MEYIEVAPGFTISRIIKGGWQLSQGHSQDQQQEDPVEGLFSYADKGVSTFDCADIYTGVEELIGRFLALRRERKIPGYIKVLTKFVPDYDVLATINKRYVERIIDRSLMRLKMERLDMVQFSWWTYTIPGWVETAGWLRDLQRTGKIHQLSLTNFNAKATKEILEAGIPLATAQVQYSLLDNRPEKELIPLCKENNMHLLCYGTVAGGFLSDRWLGVAEPGPPFENRSQVKYKLMIDEFGGWELFQSLLTTLSSIAEKHRASITNVASRYMLNRKQVGGIIIGAKSTTHLAQNLRVFEITLDREDETAIEKIVQQRKGPPGDVFDIERIKEGPHGMIMKYNLNG